MATVDSPKPNSSDCDLQETNPNPKSDSSNALVPTIQSTTPAICLLRFADDSTSVINSGVGGCCTGLGLSIPGAPWALLQSCLTFGVFSFIIEGLNK